MRERERERQNARETHVHTHTHTHTHTHNIMQERVRLTDRASLGVGVLHGIRLHGIR